MLGVVFSLISMMISSISKNYITLIGIQIPIVIALIEFLRGVLGYNLITEIGNIRFSKGLVPMHYLSIFCISIIVVFIRWRKERVLDI